jgi:fatty acid desaturase
MNRESNIAAMEFLVMMILLGCINGLTMSIGNTMLIISPVIIILMVILVIQLIHILWKNEMTDLKHKKLYGLTNEQLGNVIPNLGQWREYKNTQGATLWSNSNV